MADLKPGDTVVLRASEDWPEHLFRIDYIFDDCLGGYSLTGPFAGEYGEPEFALVLRLVSPDQEV